jgi:hypothetical protein
MIPPVSIAYESHPSLVHVTVKLVVSIFGFHLTEVSRFPGVTSYNLGVLRHSCIYPTARVWKHSITLQESTHWDGVISMEYNCKV